MKTGSKQRQMIFLFDVDGVIAETPHEKAWKAAAVEWEIISEEFNFTPFYTEKVAGEPGDRGAYNILEYLKGGDGRAYFERNKIRDGLEKKEKAREFRNPVKQRFLDQCIENHEFQEFQDVLSIILHARLDRIPMAVVSASENARNILRKIKVSPLCEDLGIPYPVTDPVAGIDTVFDTTVLGAKSYWPGIDVEKISHYAMAYGALLGARDIKVGIEAAPHVFVFEDAPKGIAAVSQLGFHSVGISRISTSGLLLASKERLREAGAGLAYDEKDLNRMSYEDLKGDIEKYLALRKE